MNIHSCALCTDAEKEIMLRKCRRLTFTWTNSKTKSIPGIMKYLLMLPFSFTAARQITLRDIQESITILPFKRCGCSTFWIDITSTHKASRKLWCATTVGAYVYVSSGLMMLMFWITPRFGFRYSMIVVVDLKSCYLPEIAFKEVVLCLWIIWVVGDTISLPQVKSSLLFVDIHFHRSLYALSKIAVDIEGKHMVSGNLWSAGKLDIILLPNMLCYS